MNKNNIVSLCYGCVALNSFSVLKYAFGFYRRSITYGWAFDLAFGSECFVNLVSDYLLLATYKDFPLPSLLFGKDSLVLLGFIAWNSTSVTICYVSSIVLAVHFANTVDLKDAMQDLKEQNVDEADFRRQMMLTTISVFTFVAFIKNLIGFRYVEEFRALRAAERDAVAREFFTLLTSAKHIALMMIEGLLSSVARPLRAGADNIVGFPQIGQEGWVRRLRGAILYNIYMYYKKTDGTDGSVEEPPTAFYFAADPTAPVPFLPPESKRHNKANASGAPPAATRCGLTGAPDTAMGSSRRAPAPAAVLPTARRPPAQQPFEVAVLRTPFMVLHMPPAELPTGPRPTTQQQPGPTPMATKTAR
ncbi:hypothetical protein MRX96_003353 [Rhipicephalus microplus]